MHLDDPIKHVGTYLVVVEVADGVTATVKTMVVEEVALLAGVADTIWSVVGVVGGLGSIAGTWPGTPVAATATATRRTPRATSTTRTAAGRTSRRQPCVSS